MGFGGRVGVPKLHQRGEPHARCKFYPAALGLALASSSRAIRAHRAPSLAVRHAHCAPIMYTAKVSARPCIKQVVGAEPAGGRRWARRADAATTSAACYTHSRQQPATKHTHNVSVGLKKIGVGRRQLAPAGAAPAGAAAHARAFISLYASLPKQRAGPLGHSWQRHQHGSAASWAPRSRRCVHLPTVCNPDGLRRRAVW